jgi:hypothetical protein
MGTSLSSRCANLAAKPNSFAVSIVPGPYRSKKKILDEHIAPRRWRVVARFPSAPSGSGLTLVPEMFSWRMGVIFEINRDFPYQVALPFDEVAMEVLAWLEGRSFEWDMYVDLPAGMVRYCFQTSADATAFTRQFVHAAQRRTVAGGD